MAIPASGPLSLQNIQTEFGGTNPIGLNEYYAGGGLVPAGTVGTYGPVPASGAIGIQNFYGTTSRVTVTLTISANTYNYDVYANAIASPSYVAGITDIVLNVGPAVYVGSTSNGTYGMTVPASFNPGDAVRINNSGFIYGCAGGGGDGGPTAVAGNPGGSGGNALFIGRPTSINNLNTIASGGGGGGGGGNTVITTPRTPRAGGPYNTFYGGGGGGGGMGYNGGAFGAGGVSNGSGAPGAAGSEGAAGGGGAGSASNPGGSGGSVGTAGTAGAVGSYGAGAGGPTGSYIVGNPLVTYIAAGTLLGNVS